MSERRNQLLLAALKRLGAPSTSDQVSDHALGLAQADDWPESLLEGLSRRAVSTCLQNMERTGLVKKRAPVKDVAARRDTPTYEPVDGFNAKAPVPAPPQMEARHSTRAASRQARPPSMSAEQMLKVLEVQDEMLSSVSRFLDDMKGVRARARRELIAAGILEEEALGE